MKTRGIEVMKHIVGNQNCYPIKYDNSRKDGGPVISENDIKFKKED